MRGGIVASRERRRVVRVAREGPFLEALANHCGTRPLRHLGDLHVADLDDGLIGRAFRGTDEAWRILLEGLVQVSLPEPVRLHGAEIAIEAANSVLQGPPLPPRRQRPAGAPPGSVIAACTRKVTSRRRMPSTKK